MTRWLRRKIDAHIDSRVKSALAIQRLQEAAKGAAAASVELSETLRRQSEDQRIRGLIDDAIKKYAKAQAREFSRGVRGKS